MIDLSTDVCCDVVDVLKHIGYVVRPCANGYGYVKCYEDVNEFHHNAIVTINLEEQTVSLLVENADGGTVTTITNQLPEERLDSVDNVLYAIHYFLCTWSVDLEEL